MLVGVQGVEFRASGLRFTGSIGLLGQGLGLRDGCTTWRLASSVDKTSVVVSGVG